MNDIRFRIARCDTLPDENHLIKKIICLSVEREDNSSEQISHCIELTGSQCLNKSNEECIDLAFKMMSGSMSNSVSKLLKNDSSIIGSYYIPN
jgi:hypothetical protein